MKRILILLTITLLTINGYSQLQGQKKLDSLLIVLKTAKEDTIIVLNKFARE
jgi:hypothetical protein